MIYASLSLNNNKDEKHLVEVTVKDLQEKVKNKDTFVLVFTQTTCGHCAQFKPKMAHVLAQNDLYGYEIVIDKLSNQEKAELKDIANIGESGTPTTVFIKNGQEEKISDRLNGNTDESAIVNKLKQNGFIE